MLRLFATTREMNGIIEECSEQASYFWSDRRKTDTAPSSKGLIECESLAIGKTSPSLPVPFLRWSGAARTEWPLLSLARANSQLPSSSTWIAETFGISRRTARRWKAQLIREKLLHQRGNSLHPTLTFEEEAAEALCVPLCFVLGRRLTPRQALALAAQRSEQRGRDGYGRYWVRSDAERAARIGVGRNTVRRARRHALSHNLIRIRYHHRGRAWKLVTAHVDERWVWGAKPGESFRRRKSKDSAMAQRRRQKAFATTGQNGATSKYPSVGSFSRPPIDYPQEVEEKTVPRKWVDNLVSKLRVQSNPNKLPPIDRAKVRADLARPELVEYVTLAADGHARAIWQTLVAARVYIVDEASFRWLLKNLTRFKANPLRILTYCQRVWDTNERRPPVIIQKSLDRVAIRGLCSLVRPPKRKVKKEAK